MSSRAELVDKISAYLTSLGPGAIQMLARSIETARANGDMDAALELVMEAVQRITLSPEERARRLARPEAEFFSGVESFVIDRTPGWKRPARISRSSLAPIWSWLHREMFSPRFSELQLDNEDAVVGMSDGDVSDIVGKFRAHCMRQLSDTLVDASSSQKMTQHFSAQLGSEEIFQDLNDIVYYNSIEPLITRFSQSLPPVIEKITDGGEKSLIKKLQLFIHQRPDDQEWAFASLIPRLSNQALLAEIAVKLAGSDDVRKIERSLGQTPLGLIHYDLAGHVKAITDISRGQPKLDTVKTHLNAYHDMLRRVSVTLDLESPSELNKSISVLRNEISGWIDQEISSISGLMRRTLRVPKDGSGSVPEFDEHTVDDCERAMAVLDIAKRIKSSLALNQSLGKVTKEVEQSFEVLFNGVLATMRDAHGELYHYCEQVTDAGIRFGSVYFGDDYADLLRRQRGAAQKQSAAG
ncbi:hypothetical protein [Coralliovum pocilloporae]|uniref:hypothetical protein n=1 Tax=Coralliovum pocilloporae TaxID=3066369 RepID=UPI00330784E6